MINEYTSNLAVQLEEYEFHPQTPVSIPVDTGEGLGVAAASYIKLHGSSLYSVHIMPYKSQWKEEIPAYCVKNNEALKNNPHLQAYRNHFAVYLFISDTPADTEILSLLAEPYEEQSLYPIYWHVCLEREKISITNDPKQPDKVLNLGEIITAAYTQTVQTDAIAVLTGKKPVDTAKNTPAITYCLGIANALMLALMELNGSSRDIKTLLQFGALETSLVLRGDYFRLVTSMFLHIGFTHFIYNMLSLFIFGDRVEKAYGKSRFITIYLISGIMGNIVSILFLWGASAGASGAVFGLLGASLAYTMKTKKSLMGLSYHTIILFLLPGIAMGFLMPGINNFAHVGGLVAGFILGVALKPTGNPPTRWPSR